MAESARANAWRDFKRDRGARVALGLLAAIAVAAVVGPWLSPFAYDQLDWAHMGASPSLSGAHWLGTDRLGRDVLVRTLYGLRISLAIGIAAAAMSFTIGVAWGAVAGFFGGRTDALMMRFVDVLHSLPYVFLVIILTTLFDRGNLVVLMLAIAAVGWLTTARIVRGQTLSVRRREFVEAAVAAGVTNTGILRRHIVPNVIGPVIVYGMLTIPQMILYESFLSFLGLGIQEPQASLGSLLNDGAREMESASWLLIVPAGCLIVLLLCFNVLGDSLRDAFDPRKR